MNDIEGSMFPKSETPSTKVLNIPITSEMFLANLPRKWHVTET